MFRAVIPRVASHSRAVALQFAPHSRGLKKSAAVCDHRYWYPRSRSASWLEDAFRSPSDMIYRMDRQFRDTLDTFSRMTVASRPDYCRRWKLEVPSANCVQVKHTSKTWEVMIHVKEFSLDNLSVRVSDNRVSVSGKHEEMQDEHGYIARQFNRTFLIPENVESATLSSSVTEDGVLIIRGTVNQSLEQGTERIINIERSTDGATKEAKRTTTMEAEGTTKEKSE